MRKPVPVIVAIAMLRVCLATGAYAVPVTTAAGVPAPQTIAATAAAVPAKSEGPEPSASPATPD